MSAYFDQLCAAMTMLSEHGALFVGQSVACEGTAMRGTLKHLPPAQLLEFPVAENCQLGFCTGIAIAGGVPVSIYPRINFLIEAVPQLVQHLDKMPIFSNGGYKPRVIIRTAVATPIPLDAGSQHLGDYSSALAMMLSTVRVVPLRSDADIVGSYQSALGRDDSTILVEYTHLYA